MNAETVIIDNLESVAVTVNAEISNSETLADQCSVNKVEDEQRLGISRKGTVDTELGHDDTLLDSSVVVDEKAVSGLSFSSAEGNCLDPSNLNCHVKIDAINENEIDELEKDDDDTADITLDLNPSQVMDTDLPQSSIQRECIKQSDFHVNDLVWAKVRNYPWWPGQVFSPSDASEKAKKYQNRHGLLIGFFSDQTFAWNEVSRVKPFHSNFSKMKKQSESESFLDAVDSALDEVSRRVQFGLSCRCYPIELSDKIRTQIVVNAGIREESSRREFGGDSHSSATSFVPMNLIRYVKQLAENPRGLIKGLDFSMAYAQLLAFNRWKGYYELPQFKVSDGLFPDDDDEDDDDELIVSSYKKLKSNLSQKKPTRIPSSSPSLIKKRKVGESDSSSTKQFSRVGASMCRVATLLVRDNPGGSNGKSSSSSSTGIKKKN